MKHCLFQVRGKLKGFFLQMHDIGDTKNVTVLALPSEHISLNFNIIYIYTGSRDSSVGIATGYGLDD
jgi:hypothetical protein